MKYEFLKKMCSFYGKINGIIYNPKTDKWKWYEGVDENSTYLTEEIDIPTLENWLDVTRGRWIYKSALGHSYKSLAAEDKPISQQAYNCPIINAQKKYLQAELSSLHNCLNYAVNDVYGKYLSGFYFTVKPIDETKNVKFKIYQDPNSINWFGTGVNMKIQNSSDNQTRTTVLNQVSEQTIETDAGDTYFAYIYAGWRFDYLDNWNGELSNIVRVEAVENCTIE